MQFQSLSPLTCWPLYRVQIKSFVEGLFTLNNNPDRFKLNLRDFLISLKEFAGDNAEMYAEEKEQQEAAAKAVERERLSKVGGLLKPAELDPDDDELWLEEELRAEYATAEGQEDTVANTRPHGHTKSDGFDGWDVYGLWYSTDTLRPHPNFASSLRISYIMFSVG
jgi:hypothetical protein